MEVRPLHTAMVSDQPSGQRSAAGGELAVIASISGLYLLLPLWWWLGAEQFIWPIGWGLLAAMLALRKRIRVPLPATARWLLIFVLAQLASGASIQEPARIITFARTLSTYLAAFLIVVSLPNALATGRQLDGLLKVTVLLLAICSAVGLLGILGIWRPSFISPVGGLLPTWVRDTTYGGVVVNRTIGRTAHFLGLTYFRVYTFFLFPNQYAVFVAIVLPLAFWMLRRAASSRGRLFYLSVIAMGLVNLVCTTGRVPVIAFLFGGAYALLGPAVRRHLKLVMAAAALLLLVGAGVVLLSGAARDSLSRAAEPLLYARGSGPVDDRMAVYGPTVRGILARPLFGWGTERDVPGAVYPAGSHSYYLGILYKHGIVGFLIWLGLAWTILREVRPRSAAESQAITYLAVPRNWILAELCLVFLTVVPDLDATAFAVLWLVLTLFMASARINQDDAG